MLPQIPETVHGYLTLCNTVALVAGLATWSFWVGFNRHKSRKTRSFFETYLASDCDTHEVTQSRENAQIVQKAVQGMGMACVIIDDTQRIVEANSAVCQMLGYGVDDLLGHRLTEITPEEYRETYTAKLNRLLMSSGFLEPCTLVALNRDDAHVKLQVLLSRSRYKDQWYLGLFVVSPTMLNRLCDLRDGLQIQNAMAASDIGAVL